MTYDKTEVNAFVQNLYDMKMKEGKHGHYESMFHCVHKAIEAVLDKLSGDVEPCAYMHPDDLKAISTAELMQQPEWVQLTWTKGTKLVPASALAAEQAKVGELTDEAFDAWFEQYRRDSWVRNGCDRDRGPEPSENWAQGLRWDFKRGWDAARAAIAKHGASNG